MFAVNYFLLLLINIFSDSRTGTVNQKGFFIRFYRFDTKTFLSL